MAPEVTYGQLMDDAAHRTAAAARATTLPLAGVAEARDAATGHGRFLAVAARHAELIGGPAGSANTDHPSRRLATTLAALSAGGRYRDDERASGPWHQAADTLALAHDVLASHLGPAWEPRGPDAALLADESQTHPALAGLADTALAAVEAARPLALQLLQVAVHLDDPGLEATAGQLIGGARGAATEVANVRDLLAGSPRRGLTLDELRPLPSQPAAVDSLDGALARLRLDAFQQARGEQAANTRTLVAYADLAVIIADRTERVARGTLSGSPPEGRARHQAALEAAHATADAWRHISSKLRSIPCTAKASLAARYVARDVWRYLDAQVRPGWTSEEAPSAAAAASSAVSVVPELADSGSRVLDRLHWQRALLRPADDEGRSIRPGAPLWIPLSVQQLTSLQRLYDRAGELTRAAGDRFSAWGTQPRAPDDHISPMYEWTCSQPKARFGPRREPPSASARR